MSEIIKTIENLRDRGRITADAANQLLTVTELEISDLGIKSMDCEIIELRDKLKAADLQTSMDTECIERLRRIGMEAEIERDRLKTALRQAKELLEKSETPFYRGMEVLKKAIE